MINSNYIILVLLLGIIIWICCNKHNNSNVSEYFTNNEKSRKSKKKYNLDNLFNTIGKSKKKKLKSRKSKLNSNFIEIQYHKDYYDTLTAINGITSQKELFNMSFLPVKETVPNSDNILELVKIFMKKLNNEINNNVSEYLHTNSGWSDMGKRRRIKSGFEEMMENELGLPGSIHNEPTTKANVKLVEIQNSEQHTSNDQIRFIVHIVIQKTNTNDQMILKVLFFMERDNLENRDNFFEKKIHDTNESKTVIIEQVFVIGYLSDNGNMKTNSDNFHNYHNITNSDGTIDQERVIKAMLQKHGKRSKELNSFMCSVDDETKELHNVPSLDDYENIKNTRTIINDLAKYPQDSFGDINL